jgi:hypothetical protein
MVGWDGIEPPTPEGSGLGSHRQTLVQRAGPARVAHPSTDVLPAQGRGQFPPREGPSIYGAEAGNLAPKLMARGGVWIGDEIAPNILPRLTEPTFIDAFLDKGRMRPLLETMPARLILGDTVGLLGAARYATS